MVLEAYICVYPKVVTLVRDGYVVTSEMFITHKPFRSLCTVRGVKYAGYCSGTTEEMKS